MSVVGRLGCCCGGCGTLGAFIQRPFPGWRPPLPGDFGEWILTGSSTTEEISDWVNRSAAYAMTDIPIYYDPNNWGPGCNRFLPTRYFGLRVNAIGTYADLTDPEHPEVVNFSYVYDALRKKELWFQDELGRVGLTTEEYYRAGATERLYAASRDETSGSWEHTGELDDWNDVMAAYTPPRTTFSYDLMGALANPLGGSARLTIEATEHNGQPAVRIIREINDPVQLTETTTLAAFTRQEVLLYNPWTFAEFENWVGSLLDEVVLSDPLHEYAAGKLYNSTFGTWNTAASTLDALQRNYEPFYTSRDGIWPNRVAINNNTSVQWFDAYWMPVAAIRHTDGVVLQLFRRRVSSTSPACLMSYEYAALPPDFTDGLDYTDACTVPTAVGLFMKTGDYVLECNAHPGGTKVFQSADIAYENGILFVGLHQIGQQPLPEEIPIARSVRPCLPLGGEYAGTPLPAWNNQMPVPIGNDVFLEEATEIEACCYP